jgi:hypothetical protein
LGTYSLSIFNCIFDTFWAVKKIKQKNFHVNLYMLRVHKDLPWKVDLSFRLCKKTKFDAKNKAFYESYFVFLHRAQKISVFAKLYKCP